MSPTAVWQSPVYEVERDLVLLIGGGGPQQPDDAKVVPGLAEEVSDSAVREALKTFRQHVELFYDAASATPVNVIKPGEAPVN
jgi:threonine synthase